MSDTQATSAVPELTPEQQRQVLLIQRQILTLQVTIHNSQRQLEQMGPALNGLLTKIATDLKIDPNAYTFDLDNLRLVPKPPVEEVISAVPAGDQIGRAS